MRIAYMLTSLGIGGAERQVVSLAQHMAARGHPVALIVLRSRQREQWPTTLEPVYLGLHKSPIGIIAGLMRARRFLRAFHPDLLHSHTYPANMIARALRLLGATPVVLSTIHNVYEGGWLRMLAYRLTDGLTLHSTAVSAAAAQRYIRLKALPADKCTVLTNAIDTAGFAPISARRTQTRAQLNAGGFIWLAAGRLSPAKDYPNLLAAFAQVHTVLPQTELWIAGEGNRTILRNLRHIIAQQGLESSVRLLGLRHDMPALLDAADAFVLSSAWEGMPLVVAEAMAIEKPVVATDVGGVRELVGDTALLVPAENHSALAQSMLSLMQESPAARQARGRAARQRIATAFNAETRFVEWDLFYRFLLSHKP